MKYRYKQTETIVESSEVLDSAVYTPVEEKEGAKKTVPKKQTAKATKK